MPKPIEAYTSISDYLIAHGYNPRSDGTAFSNGYHTIPVELIPKHSVRTFHELALKNKWIKSEQDEPTEDQIAAIYGFVTTPYGMDLASDIQSIALRIERCIKEAIARINGGGHVE